ncbi:MAG: NupC/NupG family nucleoside CNT transporter, partial [Planctomycetota bacterium]
APVLVWTGAMPRDFAFRALNAVGDAVGVVVGFAKQGADSVFGGLRQTGGFVFAIEVGAIVLVFSALMSVLYYVGFLPWLVGILSRVLHRTLGVSGAESLAGAANIFIGQTEAPLVVRPYLAGMTRSEMMALMTTGFATIAGSVMGAYIGILREAGIERGAADLLAASVMSAPAAFVFAKLLVPETGTPESLRGAVLARDRVGANLLDALAGGVTAGLKLAANIVAMLLVFYALVAMLNAAVDAAARGLFGGGNVTFQTLYAYAFSPFALLMGVPAGECVAVGQLLGTKTIFNEFVGYVELKEMVLAGRIGTRSAVLATYALCGFANFMSIGIQIGGLSSLAPERRPLFVELALRAMVGAALACQLTACVVGVIGDV